MEARHAQFDYHLSDFDFLNEGWKYEYLQTMYGEKHDGVRIDFDFEFEVLFFQTMITFQIFYLVETCTRDISTKMHRVLSSKI